MFKKKVHLFKVRKRIFFATNAFFPISHQKTKTKKKKKKDILIFRVQHDSTFDSISPTMLPTDHGDHSHLRTIPLVGDCCKVFKEQLRGQSTAPADSTGENRDTAIWTRRAKGAKSRLGKRQASSKREIIVAIHYRAANTTDLQSKLISSSQKFVARSPLPRTCAALYPDTI